MAVRRTITKTSTGLVVGDVKSTRSRRVVDVDKATMAIVRRHRATQLEQRLLVGAGYTDRGYLFAMVDGAPWNPDTIGQAFTRIVAASTLPRIRFHDLPLPRLPPPCRWGEREGGQRTALARLGGVHVGLLRPRHAGTTGGCRRSGGGARRRSVGGSRISVTIL